MLWQQLLTVASLLVLWGSLWFIHKEFKNAEEIRRIQEEDRKIRVELERIEEERRGAEKGKPGAGS